MDVSKVLAHHHRGAQEALLVFWNSRGSIPLFNYRGAGLGSSLQSFTKTNPPGRIASGTKYRVMTWGRGCKANCLQNVQNNVPWQQRCQHNWTATAAPLSLVLKMPFRILFSVPCPRKQPHPGHQRPINVAPLLSFNVPPLWIHENGRSCLSEGSRQGRGDTGAVVRLSCKCDGEPRARQEWHRYARCSAPPRAPRCHHKQAHPGPRIWDTWIAGGTSMSVSRD